MVATTLPRVVIAAPASGHGKTTVATGLMAALSAQGLSVSGHKVGPDYIDPGYHSLATGRPGRNLDAHLVGTELVNPLLLHGAHGADLAMIEGVMGLFDGHIGSQGFASTAHIASLTSSPVILVVDASHASRSIGAIVRGMVEFDRSVRIAGVIVNKVGSDRHAREVVSAIDLPVLGVLSRDDAIVAPSRHLGLIPVEERAEAVHALSRLAESIGNRVDLAAVAEIARSAPPISAAAWDPAEQVSTLSNRPIIAVAGGRAFTFRYTETEELLRAAGAEVVHFDPLTATELPSGAQGLYLGGGFPEVHAAGLAANTSLRRSVRDAVRDRVPTLAECAGLLYLCRTLDRAPMAGAIDADATMTSRLTLAYRSVRTTAETVLGPAETVATGHEFHRTTVEPSRGNQAAWLSDTGEQVGFASSSLHASYIHTHGAGSPQLVRGFLNAVGAGTARSGTARSSSVRSAHHGQLRPHPDDLDMLRHHGDREAVAGKLDFAVNVETVARPRWLEQALADGIAASTQYPDPSAAEAAIADRHGLHPTHVLATAGAAEAFGLIARLRTWRRPVVIQPQFTEPELALRLAGLRPTSVFCDPIGFTLGADLVPADADLVILGNPTNPTGVLHPAATIAQLAHPGRTVVVDEAFMDAVPGESASVIKLGLPNVVVIRSLTKMWSMPGIRAGYVVAGNEEISALRAVQTPWSVSSPAIWAMIACSSAQARAETAHRVCDTTRHRAVLTDGLSELSVRFIASHAPFVLAQVGAGVHDRLADAGYAVRRADTFTGLDDRWVRIAVRPPELTRKLLAALRIELT